MKKLLLLCAFLSCSTLSAQIKTWKLSTAADFSHGVFDGIVSTTLADGELRLASPFMHVGNDTVDASTPSAVSYDDAGNFVIGWIASKRVYIQKFNRQRQPVTAAIVADENAQAYDLDVAVALLNDGRCVISWRETDYPSSNVPRFVQFFDSLLQKVGRSRIIFTRGNPTASVACPIADQVNKRFLFVSTEKTSIGYQAYGWFYSADGLKLRDSIKIVPSSPASGEYGVRGACHDGKFAFVWTVINTIYVTGDEVSYVMYSDSNAVPLTAPIPVNADGIRGGGPKVAFDDAGNCCVIWMWQAGYMPGPISQIYGRAFNASGEACGGVVKASNLQEGGISWWDVSSTNGRFRIAYGQVATDGTGWKKNWASYWMLAPALSGTFVSGIFDAGSQQVQYENISWNGTTSSGTRLKYRLRSATSEGEIASAPWTGPTSTGDYYTTASGEPVNAALNGRRYLQLSILFESDTNGSSPVLNDVSVTYRPNDVTAPDAVPHVRIRGEHRRIVLEWEKSPSADVKSYRVYRAMSGMNFNPDSFIVYSAQSCAHIDSAVTYDTLYRYGITAVDSTFNESGIVETASVSSAIMKIFVSPSGSASGDGTSAKPFQTINKAIANSFRGDTIYVLPGEYTEDCAMKEGTALIGGGASTTKIISSNSMGALTTAPHTLVKGFTFLVAAGIVGGGADATITENILLHQGSTFDAGILPGGYKNVVVSKNILMNFSLGIVAVGMWEIPDNSIMIRNNIIYGHVGIQNIRANVSITNNTIVAVGAAGFGAAIDPVQGPTVVTNNCLAGYSSDGSSTRAISKPMAPFGSLAFGYNDRWNFTADLLDSTAASNIAVDPRFVNAAKHNYHLGEGSLCTDAGDPAAEYNDKDGSRNDIGAYGGPDPLPDYLTFALPVELSLKGGTGFPGDTATVNINLSNAAGVKKADIDVLYDADAVTLIGAASSPLTNGFAVALQGTQIGKRRLHLEGASEIASGSGSIATLRFKLNPSISAGLQSAVEIGGAEIRDGDNNRLVLSSITSALIVIKSPVPYPHRMYVDAGYSGPSDGTLLHPYAGIQQGIDNAKAGDTVCISAGTYTGPIVMKSDVYVRGAGAAATTIRCPGDVFVSMPTVIRFNNVQHSGVSNCTLVNEASAGVVVDAISSDVDIAMNKIDQSGMAMYTVIATAGSHLDIHDNFFTESKNGGFSMITLASAGANIVRNVFSPATAQVMIELGVGARATVANNRFYSIASAITGMQSKHSVFANNLFAGSATAGAAMKLVDAESTWVFNNIFDTKNTAIDENNGLQQIFNNVFYGNVVGMNSTSPHRFNDFWKTTTSVMNGSPDATEMAGDPRFSGVEKGNYRPSAGSILFNSGDPASEWNDKDGSRSDIGIYGGPYADASMFASENIRLRIGCESGSAGDSLTIPVIASGIVGISGMQLMIEYDADRLRLLNVHTASSTRSFSMVQKNIGQSIVAVEMYGSDPVVIDSAAVAELAMLVLPKASGSAYVKFQNVSVRSGATQMIAVENMENGTVALSPASVNGKDAKVPNIFSLAQNFPNPFNPSTTLRYALPMNSRVKLHVYNVLGQQVAELVNMSQSAGMYSVTWNANVASGMYFYRLEAVSQADPNHRFIETKKMILMH